MAEERFAIPLKLNSATQEPSAIPLMMNSAAQERFVTLHEHVWVAEERHAILLMMNSAAQERLVKLLEADSIGQACSSKDDRPFLGARDERKFSGVRR